MTPLLTPDEVASLLRISLRTVYENARKRFLLTSPTCTRTLK
jgi:hypothetical protein